MPDALSVVLLGGAIASALAVHDRVSGLERDVQALDGEVQILRSDVTEIKRALLGTLADASGDASRPHLDARP